MQCPSRLSRLIGHIRIVGLLMLLVLIGCAERADDEPAPIRNVVFIMGDDHAAYTLGAYGSPIAETPNLDRLAAEGVRFDRAYTNAPVCTPSRQSLLTGKLPHATGVNLLFTPLSKDEVTLADHLKPFGFASLAVGKMHFNNNEGALRHWGYADSVIATIDPLHGFDAHLDRHAYRQHLEQHPARISPDTLAVRPPWRPFRDPASTWLNAEARPGRVYDADSEGTFFAHEAMRFLQDHQDQRFLLWLSFYEPHSPFHFPVEEVGRFDPADMPVPPVSAEDERWIPTIFKDLTDTEKQGITAAYHTSVAHLDKNIGLVLDELDRLGLADSTLVIYVGDHGYLLGHHGRFEKHMMWEEAVHAPLLIRNRPRFGEKRSSPAFVEFIDLVPTIVDALGLPPMQTTQGESLLPLLDGKTDRHRDYVFSEYLTDNKAMIRTENWKYIFTAGKHDLAQGYATGNPPPGITHRLYDVQNDPSETTNLAHEPSLHDTLAALKQTMLDRFVATHPEGEALPPGLSIDDALVWFSEPRDPRPAVAIQ